MARARPVSRQHIQAIVDELRGNGLVRRLPNPSHRRSPLVELTPRGRAKIAVMEERERTVLARLDLGVAEDELRGTAATLRAVREGLERGLAEGTFTKGGRR